MSTDAMKVRAAGAADVAAVILLERETAEAPHWSEAEYWSVVELAAGGDLAAGGVRRCIFVAEVGERVVGFAVGKAVGSGGDVVGELESVAVSGSVRRRGLGRALCDAVVVWCQKQGAIEVELEVRAGSAGAIALYEGLGFRGVGRRRGYYREPVDDALLMRLELAN
jgi:ribosomal-protein-alanine N-acetyltransferase